MHLPPVHQFILLFHRSEHNLHVPTHVVCSLIVCICGDSAHILPSSRHGTHFERHAIPTGCHVTSRGSASCLSGVMPVLGAVSRGGAGKAGNTGAGPRPPGLTSDGPAADVCLHGRIDFNTGLRSAVVTVSVGGSDSDVVPLRRKWYTGACSNRRKIFWEFRFTGDR